jgi:hypothetical protein
LQAVLLAEVAADAVFAWWKGSEDVFLCVAEVLVVDVQCAALVAHGCVLAAGDAVDFDVHDFFFLDLRFTIYDRYINQRDSTDLRQIFSHTEFTEITDNQNINRIFSIRDYSALHLGLCP